MSHITKTNEKLFAKALELAEFGEHRVRVGAIVAIKSTKVAGAFNTIRNTTTHGVDFTAHTIHAEDRALQLTPYELRNGASIYICRIDVKGKLVPSRPCRFCDMQIRTYRLKEIVFWDQTLQKIRL